MPPSTILHVSYVDDLILCGTKEAIQLVTNTLNGKLKIKETVESLPLEKKITFLGQEIERQGSHFRMRVPPAYMDALFKTEFCKDVKVVTAPPDIVKTVEKGRASGSDPELSDAAAARYPIRFLKGQYHAWQCYGPNGDVPDSGPAQLEVYADASWAPQALLGQRSVSGIAIFYRGCLIKGIFQVQGCVSLSSCKAKLRASPDPQGVVVSDFSAGG